MARSSILKPTEYLSEGDVRYFASELLNYDDHEEEIDLSNADIFSLGTSMLSLIMDEQLPKNGSFW